MDHQAEPNEKLAENPERIWLAPRCNVDERSWCEDDIGCCDECGEPTVEYRRSDLVDAEIAGLKDDALRLHRDKMAYYEAALALVHAETIKNVCGWYPEIEAFRKLLGKAAD